MMRLITLFPRRVGLSIGGGRYTHSHIPPSALYNIHRNKTWTRCSFASITTSANDTQDPAPASSQDIDLDEYMKSAAETIASRKPRISIDNMSTTPSYLLNLALADHLPASCQPDLFAARHSKHGAYGMLPTSLTDSRPPPLPEGHHLVYFPLQVSSNGLMADGTDKDHYPGWPFVRRMWAGGSVNFISHQNRQLYLDNNLAFCIETLGKPVLKRGVVPGEEMVFIDVKRRYFKVTLLREIVELRRAHGGKGEFDETEALRSLEGMRSLVSSIAETRKLVFMRERATTPSRSPEPVAETLMQASPSTSKSPKSPNKPHVFSFEITPDQTLLFHFSALTYNAHAIHLDKEYAKNVEGYKGLLVHGPLTLLLMLSALRSQCKTTGDHLVGPTNDNDNAMMKEFRASKSGSKEWMVRSIDYRNLRPLYAGEKMTVSVRLKKTRQERIPGVSLRLVRGWAVWIDGPDGRLAVKGEAVTVSNNFLFE